MKNLSNEIKWVYMENNSGKFLNELKLNIRDSSRMFKNGPTYDCDIYLKNRSLLKEVSIVKLNDSTVVLSKNGVRRNVNIAELNKIRFSGPSGFWTGAAIAAGISIAGWTFVGLAFGEGKYTGDIFLVGLIGAIPCGLVGGLVGLLFDREDTFYDFSSGNPKAKLKRLRYIIDKHTPTLH
jgi:hypothetical protein